MGPEDEGNVTDVVMLDYRRHAMLLEVPAETNKKHVLRLIWKWSSAQCIQPFIRNKFICMDAKIFYNRHAAEQSMRLRGNAEQMNDAK